MQTINKAQRVFCLSNLNIKKARKKIYSFKSYNFSNLSIANQIIKCVTTQDLIRFFFFLLN